MFAAVYAWPVSAGYVKLCTEYFPALLLLFRELLRNQEQFWLPWGVCCIFSLGCQLGIKAQEQHLSVGLHTAGVAWGNSGAVPSCHQEGPVAICLCPCCEGGQCTGQADSEQLLVHPGEQVPWDAQGHGSDTQGSMQA